MIAASSLGFRAAALTFLNRPAVVAIIFQAWRKCGHRRPKRKSPACNFGAVAGLEGIPYKAE
jgi:hypothetical protein